MIDKITISALVKEFPGIINIKWITEFNIYKIDAVVVDYSLDYLRFSSEDRMFFLNEKCEVVFIKRETKRKKFYFFGRRFETINGIICNQHESFLDKFNQLGEANDMVRSIAIMSGLIKKRLDIYMLPKNVTLRQFVEKTKSDRQQDIDNKRVEIRKEMCDLV